MRFLDQTNNPLQSTPALAAEYKAAERLFSARFGTEHLFLPRLLRARTIAYTALRQAFLQMEFVECPTSEFPAENYIYWVSFCDEAEHALQLRLDSYTKAARILERLAQAAPHVQIRIPPKPPALL